MRFFARTRLALEVLERRDLLAVMRFVSWNAFNSPNDAAADGDFQTILAAIGAEAVAGNAKRVDLLALQETDVVGSGDNSIGRIEAILDGLYPSTNYASLVSSLDGGGDATGFVYDTSTLSLLGSMEVASGSLTHTVLRAQFRPIDTAGESDFYAYSVHLKSGDTGSDESLRAAEAALLRSDADLLGDGANILMLGDFNMTASFESAYATLTASGAGQLFDPIASPGAWRDNGAFKGIHTQNPRDAMDDRFDLQLVSGELFDAVGFEYIANSYRVFGNNGSHTLNAAITTGTGASVDVLTALVNASDHLPVVADYETVTAVPNVRVRQTGGGTKAVEGGLFDSYRVVLDTVPTADVTVTLTPDSQVDLNGVTQLVFTPANALTPQTVIVRAADDMAGEGNHTGAISHSVASADLDYDGLSVAGVTVDIVDNDAPTIVINELDSDTEGVDTLEFVELYDGGVGNTSLSGLSLVFFNGDDANNASYRVLDLTGHATDADGFFVAGNVGVSPDLAFPNNGLQNGADAVALYSGPFSTGSAPTVANLLDAIVYDTDDPDDAVLLTLLEGGQPQVNENEGGNKDFESLSRSPDHGFPRRTDTYVAQSPTPAALNAPPAAGVTILQSGLRVDVEEGGPADLYLLVLDTIPTAAVTITVDPDDQTDLGSGAGAPIMLTFTPADALSPQVVVVMAVDDAVDEGQHASVITHTTSSADPNYHGLAVDNVTASIIDNDLAPPPRIVISEIMYDPASNESGTGIGEWIELVNIGAAAVDLGGWLFDDEDAADWGPIPTGTTLAPGRAAVFFDNAFTTAAAFRAEWSVPVEALVVGIPWAGLANSPSPDNEVLSLRDALGAEVDVVNYDDVAPWPTNSNGPSIYLAALLADNNDGAQWKRSDGDPAAISPTGPTYSTADVGSPGRVPALADFNGDGLVSGGDFLRWQIGFGLLAATKPDGDADNDADVDDFDLSVWMSQFGASASFAESSASVVAAESAIPGELVDAAMALTWLDVADDDHANLLFMEEFRGFVPSAIRSVSSEAAVEDSQHADSTMEIESSLRRERWELAEAGWLSDELLESLFS